MMKTDSTEGLVREFASQYPTPQVRRAVRLCESGQLTWAQVADLFQVALREGLKEVSK